MGKSKFPGKPSKSVMKDRIRVLNKHECENLKGKKSSGDCTSYLHSENENVQVKYDRSCSNSSKSQKQTTNNNRDDKIKQIKKKYSSELLKQNKGETQSFARDFHEIPSQTCAIEKNNRVQKKTVTFRNILETSDDTLTSRTIHNPLNKGPLVSIMKKDSIKSQHYMQRKDRIVRPSRLTKILKNNANIDKTKFLSFRSVSLPINSFESIEYKNQLDEQNDNCKLIQKIFLTDERTTNKPKLEDNNENVKNCEKLISDNKLLDKWKMQKLIPVKKKMENQDENAVTKPESSKRKDSSTHCQITLRQPRLLFETSDDISPDVKKDVPNDDTNPCFQVTKLCNKTSICGVCCTTVNYKHIQQTRKYGITACELCKTFISKITKRTITASPNSSKAFKLQCIKKEGECLISSLPNKNLRSFKTIYVQRCSACWLKKCLQSFHFPPGHKLRLSSLISETQSIDIKPINKSQGLYLINANDSDSEKCYNDSQAHIFNRTQNIPVKENNKSTRSPKKQTALSNSIVKESITLELFPKTTCTEGVSTRYLNKNGHQIANENIELQESAITTSDYPKRQKIAFKGPRVKHVCRSASIALGQQMATFSNDEDESLQLLQSKPEINNGYVENGLDKNLLFNKSNERFFSEPTAEETKKVQIQFEKKVNFVDYDNDNGLKKVLEIGPCIQNIFKVDEENSNVSRDRKHVLNTIKNNHQYLSRNFNGSSNLSTSTIRSKFVASKRNSNIRQHENKSKMISIDFWDTYVPGEVNQTGFGLILTEPVSVFALCFLCGSVDLNNLLFCVCCCEPYHSYCIQEAFNDDAEFFDKKEAWSPFLNHLNWMCPRCTVCDTCNMSSGAKIKCQKCKKNYHNTCMGTSKGLLGANRPLICSNCLKCQFCSTSKVSKYVGNQPTCFQCFIQRRSLSTCSICQKCVDTVLDLIILECGVCNEFIHAKCEGLTEEQTNLLSSVAGNIKFVCNKCSLSNINSKVLAKQWREAVCKELRNRLLQVLKLLSKSRLADILKESIKTSCLCGFDKCTKDNHKTEVSYDSYKYKLNNITGSTFQSKCFCSKSSIPKPTNSSLSLLRIKKKIINGEYVSLFDFNADMNDVIIPLKNDELLLTYKEILCEKFSWFQNETKTCTDALEEDMFDSCNYSLQSENIIAEDQSISTILPLPMLEQKVFSPLKQTLDKRTCIFCLQKGDGELLQESRLLYYGFDSWVHVNCALWSLNVYEEFDGSLQNVHTAFNRGKITKCVVCKNYGATIKCNVKTCSNYYHFHCARKTQCLFEYEISMFCSLHSTNHKNAKNNPSTENLNASRPLYVECNKPHKKYVEPFKVQFMIGSLCVIQLGNVYLPFSDTSEAIIPINFICTRLYWSSKEPWKVIKYRVRTSIQNSSVTMNNEQDKNFTVDHSKNKRLVEKDLSHISCWHNTIRDNNLDKSVNIEHNCLNNLRFSKNVDFQNETFLDTYIEEEPQNNSDLLPPEIEEAIFEDLPNDILEGISMLDIFPKLMIHKELEGPDEKQETINEHFDSQSQPSRDCLFVKKQDSKLFTQKRELQRSNSEVFLKNVEVYRSQQRSSSVTWGYTIENKNCIKNDISELNLSEPRVTNLNCLKFEKKIRDAKIISNSSEENRKLTPFKQEKIELMQLDGADDHIVDHLSEQFQNTNSKTPLKCDRCHCTYRTFDSFQRHFVNCEQIFTSESETDTSSRSPDAESSTTVVKDELNKYNFQFDQNRFLRNQNVSTNLKPASHLSNFSDASIIPRNIASTKSVCVNMDKASSSSSSIHGLHFNTRSIGIKQKEKIHRKNNIKNSRVNNEHCSFVTKHKEETVVSPMKISGRVNILRDKDEYLQQLNQTLLFNDQYPQQEQENQQQFVIIQQTAGNSQPMFLHHVSNAPSTIPQNMFPVLLNNPAQYASVPTYTNSLMQTPIWHSDCNVMLSSGVQMLPMPSLQLASSSPHIVSSFNLPQALQIGASPVLLGGTSTMDLIPNHNQLLLAPQPVFYGLETIVQNTVMSSQQFVSTAIQGVLSQNASFSATTTQVFQSSKFEPVSDTSTNYVVLNNTDGSTLVVPQSSPTGLLNTNCSSDFQIGYNPGYGHLNGPHSQPIIQQSELSNILPLMQSVPEIINTTVEIPTNELQETFSFATKQTVQSSPLVKNSLHSKNENQVCQTWLQNSSSLCSMEKLYSDNASISTIRSNYVNDNNVFSTKDVGVSEVKTTSAEINKTNAKQKVQITPRNIKRKKNSSLPISQIGLKVMYKNVLQKELKLKQHHDVILESPTSKTEIFCELLSEPTFKDISVPHTSSNTTINYINSPLKSESKNSSEIPEPIKSDFNNEPTSIVNRLESRKPINLSPTKLPFTTGSFGNSLHNVPTNVVVPVMQVKLNKSTTSRPTNRVLPMQSIQKQTDTSQPKTSGHNLVNKSSQRPAPLEVEFLKINDFEYINPLKDGSESEKSVNITDSSKIISAFTDSFKENKLMEYKTPSFLKEPNETVLDNKNLVGIEQIPNSKNSIKTNKDPINSNALNNEKILENQKTIQNEMIIDSYNPVKIVTNICSNNDISVKNVHFGIERYNKNLWLEDEKKETELITKSKEVSNINLSKESDQEYLFQNQIEDVHLTCKESQPPPTKMSKQFDCDKKTSLASTSKKPHVVESIKKNNEPYLIFEIQSEDGFTYKSQSIADVWEKVFEAVQNSRRAHGLPSYPIGSFVDICGVQILGLKTNALKYLIEQLPGTDKCQRYTPKYHENDSSKVSNVCTALEVDIDINKSGAARFKPFAKRSPYDMFSWLASIHRNQPKQIFVQPSDTELIARRCTANLPMAMKYRTLKETCKLNVGVFRSLIHGRGLFCIKDMEASEMVIEYAGELIRSTLADKRERFYDNKGIGCYMFKIDEHFVVDATMRGNAARFINHSCEPNCYSKVVDILGHKHIIIFSLRRIVKGEELTYDYKFPFEDVKIHCYCASKKCRKYLN